MLGRHPRRVVVVTLLAALFALPILAGPASAHDEKKAGKFAFSIGFREENPTLAGTGNAIEVRITQGGKPVKVTDADAEVLLLHLFVGAQSKPDPTREGNKPMPIPLHATPWTGEVNRLESKGFVPARPGDYTVHLHTPVKGDPAGSTETKLFRGTKVDLVYVTGENTYGPVTDPKTITYPAGQPTTAELAQRIGRMETRNVALAAVARESSQDLEVLQDQVLIAGAILVAGVLLTVIVGAVRRRRRRDVPTDPSDRPGPVRVGGGLG
jgi:hypothetical protein